MNLRIDKAQARKRFDDLCYLKNAEAETFTFERVQSGRTQTITRKKKAISDGAQQTGKALILSYCYHYRVKTQLMPEGWFSEEMPSLPTNGEKLANFRQNISSRTIRNHIRELKNIGLIVKYKFHGSKHDYQLWLNPEIIFSENISLTSPGVVFSNPEKTETPPFSGTHTTATPTTNGINFPHRQSKDTNGNHSTSTRKAEDFHQKGTHLNGNTASKPQNMTFSHGNGGAGGGGGGPKNVDNSQNSVDNSQNSVDNSVDKWKMNPEPGIDYYAQHKFFQKKIFEFYVYATKSLWAEQEFTKSETLMALDTITDGVYRDFLNLRPNQNQFNEFQDELYRSIDVAAKYYSAKVDQYPGDPYSINQNQRGYFDRHNKKGFKVAQGWRFANKARNHEDYGKRLVKLAMLHLENHPKGKAPKHLQVKTYSELLNFYMTKIKAYGPEVQRMFAFRLKTINIKAV